MSDQIIYLSRWKILDGKLESFEKYAKEIADIVEKEEPGAISFSYFVDEDRKRGTAVFLFSSAEALDIHLDLLAPRFEEGYQYISGTDVEILGRPSKKAAEMAASFGAKFKNQQVAGFTRLVERADSRR